MAIPESEQLPQQDTFAERFGALLGQLRAAPGDAAGVADAVDAATRMVADAAAHLEAGIENSWDMDGDPLKARLLARAVDAIDVAPGASGAELLALAQALADQAAPLPNTERVRVTLIPSPGPGSTAPLSLVNARQDRLPLGRMDETPPALAFRHRPGDQLSATIQQIVTVLEDEIRRGAWLQALHNAQATLRMLPGIPEEIRRSHAILLRRILTTKALQAFIEQAYRVMEEQARTGEVLRFMGIKGAELMLENLRAGESIGPRAFLLDALGGMPETYPIIVPLLNSERWQDQRLAVDLLGRQGRQEAVPLLAAKVNHPDERIRLAAIDALANFRDKLVLESLRQALVHASPRTRAEAGKAMGRRRSGAIAMPLLAALASEKDHEVRRELLQVLVDIEAPEASAALVRVATERRGLLGGGGRPTAERLEVVSALAISRTHAARQALSRIAVEADGQVKAAASRALGETGSV